MRVIYENTMRKRAVQTENNVDEVKLAEQYRVWDRTQILWS